MLPAATGRTTRGSAVLTEALPMSFSVKLVEINELTAAVAENDKIINSISLADENCS